MTPQGLLIAKINLQYWERMGKSASLIMLLKRNPQKSTLKFQVSLMQT
jgi:hypothetical protein